MAFSKKIFFINRRNTQNNKFKTAVCRNVNYLLNRARFAYHNKDYPLVLHSCASVYETLAKFTLIKYNPKIMNKSLLMFFEAYRNHSFLPPQIIDYIESVFKLRNSEPLAGHGSIDEPAFSKANAYALIQLTRAVVKIKIYYLNKEINF